MRDQININRVMDRVLVPLHFDWQKTNTGVIKIKIYRISNKNMKFHDFFPPSSGPSDRCHHYASLNIVLVCIS